MEVPRTLAIYVIALSEGKYYIGRSELPEERILDHFSGSGSTWTKTYPPQKVVSKSVGDVFDEDKTTKQYMHKYGIANVRGASYAQLTLTSDQIVCLTRELDNVDDRCFTCHKKGHFVTKCPGIDDELDSLISGMAHIKLTATETKHQYVCYGCGVKGHFIANCPSKRDSRTLLCTRCGRNTHRVDRCYARTHLDGSWLSHRL